MVYPLKMVIFHGYVSHNQMVHNYLPGIYRAFLHWAWRIQKVLMINKKKYANNS